MKKILYLILAFFFLTGFFPSLTFAQTPNNVRREDRIILESTQTVDDDYFATGEGVTISGTVNGDVFILAGKTYIDGTINGDVLAASGQVTISGPVTGDVRVAGGDVILNSPVGGNVTVLGGNILLEDSATIAGSLTGAVGNARILSPIGKSIHISGGQITLGSEVGKNIKTAVGKLALINGAHVKGDLVYISDEEIDISGGATIDGAIVKKVLPEQVAARKGKEESKKAFMGFVGFGTLFGLVNSFIWGALLLGFAPRYTSSIIETVRKRFWQSLLVGFVFCIVTPVVLILLAATIFGIPLALLGGIGYVLLMMFGKIMFALYLGTKAQKYVAFAQNKYLVLLLGIIIYFILELIPIVGWIIGIVGSLAGLGALVMGKKEMYTQLRTKKLL